ncbi:MAG: cyclic nucleotide-binding domain-containing protein [Candidatus Gracilibacteria bacterium]|nr:cyclic nucleotide-binding domain-containing protein [Candidatus Gracilibacteria bacterium]
MQNIKIFRGIEQEDVNYILSKCNIEIFGAGREIMSQGEESNGKGYIIKSGEVEIFVDNKERKTLGEGDVFGEIALLNDGERTATVIAKTEVETYILTQDSLIEIINNYSNAINKQIMQRIEENLDLED